MGEQLERMLSGDQGALAQLISLVEGDDPRAAAVMRSVHGRTGKAYCVAVTGFPGSGKSTLVARLTARFRKRGLTVGVVAVDPSSPYSGGAFLGDRVRMGRHYVDPGVFIRSMSTRGARGGVAGVVRSVVRLLDASGKDVVVVETVGVGQTEPGAVNVADTVVLVVTPEAGDAVQALKAGVLETADILVVNKADREGASELEAHLRALTTAGGSEHGGWGVPVVKTQAITGEGVEQLDKAIQDHRQFMEAHGGLEERRRRRRKQELLEMLEERLSRRLRERIVHDPAVEAALVEVEDGLRDPYSAAVELLEGLAGRWHLQDTGSTKGG